MMQAVLSCPYVCAAVSPLSETILHSQETKRKEAEFIVTYDALDGASNLHAGVNTGTIFGIYRRLSKPGSEISNSDALQVRANGLLHTRDQHLLSTFCALLSCARLFVLCYPA
jgi:fructose-1,6-bisphosphatase